MINHVIGYKSAKNFIIKVRIDFDDITKTNLDRDRDYISKKNKPYAKYRTSRAFILEIYNKDKKEEKINRIKSDFNDNFEYIVGEYKEEPNFDTRPYEINTYGIHFFLSEEPAFFRNKEIKTGNQKIWSEDGHFLCDYNFVNYKQHGRQTEFYLNGQIQSNGNYVNGEKHGRQKEWFDNGQIKSNKIYRNGKEHGIQKEWYENRQLKLMKNYKNGKLHYNQKEWFENGKMKSNYFYHKNKLHKNQKEWFENGQIKSDHNFVHNKIHGIQKGFDENGNIQYKWIYDINIKIEK